MMLAAFPYTDEQNESTSQVKHTRQLERNNINPATGANIISPAFPKSILLGSGKSAKSVATPIAFGRCVVYKFNI